MQRFLGFLVIALSVTGCYATHSRLVDDCLDDCQLVADSCSTMVASGEFLVEECSRSCESPESRSVLFPDCAECFITSAQCEPRYIQEFCLMECGF